MKNKLFGYMESPGETNTLRKFRELDSRLRGKDGLLSALSMSFPHKACPRAGGEWKLLFLLDSGSPLRCGRNDKINGQANMSDAPIRHSRAGGNPVQ
jgi:hypothetical protein